MVAQWSIHGRTTMHKTHRDSPKATVGSIFFGKPDPDAVGAKALVERLGNNYTSSIVGTKTKRVVYSDFLQAFLRSNLVVLFVVIIGEHLKELMRHLSNLSTCATAREARMMSYVFNIWIALLFPTCLGKSTLFTIAHQGALVRGSPTRTCQFSGSAWWGQP